MSLIERNFEHEHYLSHHENHKCMCFVDGFNKCKEMLLVMVRDMKNPYPSDIFVGETKDGEFGKFGNRVVENIRHDLMEMLEGENDNVTLEQKIKNDAHKLDMKIVERICDKHYSFCDAWQVDKCCVQSKMDNEIGRAHV